MANIFKERPVSRLNKDFAAFRRRLVQFSQAHHSGAFSDFNAPAGGMALLEHGAFIGDVLAFYIDQTFLELRGDTARQLDNVQAFAKQRGYRPSGPRPARGTVAVAVVVPAVTNVRNEVVPNELYSPVLLKGAAFGGPDGTRFETLEDVSFSASFDRMVTGSRFDSSTGIPTHFALRKNVEVVAGETKTESAVVGAFKPFRAITLSDSDVSEIISVVDSDGNEWTEVDYLAQDMIFSSDTNSGPDSDVVPYSLKLVPVPRRFIVDTDVAAGTTSLIFGSGDGSSFDDELVPNLADIALPLAGRRSFSSFALDPRNFLRTRSLGLCPHDVTLSVTYRAGGGRQTNVAARSIRDVVQAALGFSTTALDPSTKSDTIGSLACLNLVSTDGGADRESIQEIKENAAAFYASQDRAVTREDYIVRVLSLPTKFGKPDKVFVKRNPASTFALDIHVLARDTNEHLALASTTLKQNIATYLSRYRMLTDGVNIMDSDIINLKCAFGVVASPRFNRTEVLARCVDELSSALHTDRMQPGQAIVLSDLVARLQSVQGVVAVYDLRFENVFGTKDSLPYSDVRFDAAASVRNGILYCPDDSIFEVKYPRRDIVGTVK